MDKHNEKIKTLMGIAARSFSSIVPGAPQDKESLAGAKLQRR
ncbi:hypothetical protein [Aneurinibacillus migulanus]|nr:hypothetical protein [Aneurinibacillus migulanus]